MSNIDVIYTFWSNLKKTADMEIGQIGFHDNKNVRSIHVEKRSNEIVNRLNKTKVSLKIILAFFQNLLKNKFQVVKNNVNFQSEREERDRKERNKEKQVQREIKLKEKEDAKRKEEAAQLRSYDYVMKTENMRTNEVSIRKIKLKKKFPYLLL